MSWGIQFLWTSTIPVKSALCCDWPSIETANILLFQYTYSQRHARHSISLKQPIYLLISCCLLSFMSDTLAFWKKKAISHGVKLTWACIPGVQQQWKHRVEWLWNMSFTSRPMTLKIKCLSLRRYQGMEAIRMQALQLWISDWIELRSKLWSESTFCCHATARGMAVHTKQTQRTTLYLDSLPHTLIIHFCLFTTGRLFFRGLPATDRIIAKVCRSTLA